MKMCNPGDIAIVLKFVSRKENLGDFDICWFIYLSVIETCLALVDQAEYYIVPTQDQ